MHRECGEPGNVLPIGVPDPHLCGAADTLEGQRCLMEDRYGPSGGPGKKRLSLWVVGLRWCHQPASGTLLPIVSLAYPGRSNRYPPTDNAYVQTRTHAVDEIRPSRLLSLNARPAHLTSRHATIYTNKEGGIVGFPPPGAQCLTELRSAA